MPIDRVFEVIEDLLQKDEYSADNIVQKAICLCNFHPSIVELGILLETVSVQLRNNKPFLLDKEA